VSVADVVTGFRADTGGAPAEGPEPGVYVYATSGFEETDALFGSRHDYPAETAVTVRAGGCGYLERWEPLRGRLLTRELCPGRRLARLEEVHTFFGTRDVHDYVCEPGTPAPPLDAKPGTVWETRCGTGDTVEVATGEVLVPETVEVGGRTVAAVRVAEELRLEGNTTGTGTRDWWLHPETGLTLRLAVTNSSVTESAIGGVGYEERYELVLTSLEPRR
jgi:hypothetical protein